MKKRFMFLALAVLVLLSMRRRKAMSLPSMQRRTSRTTFLPMAAGWLTQILRSLTVRTVLLVHMPAIFHRKTKSAMFPFI